MLLRQSCNSTSSPGFLNAEQNKISAMSKMTQCKTKEPPCRPITLPRRDGLCEGEELPLSESTLMERRALHKDASLKHVRPHTKTHYIAAATHREVAKEYERARDVGESEKAVGDFAVILQWLLCNSGGLSCMRKKRLRRRTTMSWSACEKSCHATIVPERTPAAFLPKASGTGQDAMSRDTS
jgi:hypothetical protein